MSNERFISTSEAAHRLGVHQTTIQRMVRDGRLRGQKVGKARNSPYVLRETSVNLLLAHKSGKKRP